MWFLGKWNTNIIWLRNLVLTPFGTIWAKAKTWPTVSILGAGIALFAVYFYKTPIWNILDHADDGKIIVNSPTVYTRQRLVNDRLDQASWLRSQLKATDVGSDLQFKSVDQVRHVYSDTAVGLAGAKAETESGERSDGSRGPTTIDRIEVDATTMASFRAKNAYRDEVRSELTQTELDDRHDIDGNTIFRLTFDATVIAGTINDSVAAIGIELKHEPMRQDLKDLYDADYRTLYQDWIEYFQRTLRKSLTSIPKSLQTPEPYPRLRLLFTEFLLGRLCQFLEGDSKWEDKPPLCPVEKPELRQQAVALLKVFTTTRSANLRVSRLQAFKDRLKDFQHRKLVFGYKDLKVQEELAINACRANPVLDRISIANLSILGADGNPTRDEIGCPFYDNLKERLLAGVLLYERFLPLIHDQAPPDYKHYETALIAGIDTCEERKCDVELKTLKCFTADFLKSNLNAFQDQKADAQQKISHFLNLKIVGRDVDDCDLLVTGKIKRYQSKPKISAEKQKPNAGTDEQHVVDDGELLKDFITYLNRETDAFAYSVTPKNLTENIATASDTRDAFAVLLRAKNDGGEVANLIRKRSQMSQGIVSHPIVVGFGSGSDAIKPKADDGASQLSGAPRLDFGWIVAPRERDTGNQQVDGQYPLAAFISVPAWWRTVEINIKTCWLPRTAIAKLNLDQGASKVCDTRPNVGKNELLVRLPPAVAEISRKLAFDVVQLPSLYETAPKELVVGVRGALLLEGARLWRSTEVTAGAQHADKITVLPNMEGILAEFDCVQPPNGIRHLRLNEEIAGKELKQIVTYDWVKVWTSEGATEGIPVAFLWPNNVDPDNLARLCPKKSAPAPEATSIIASTTPTTVEPARPGANPPPAGVSTLSDAKLPQVASAKPPPAPSSTTPSAKPPPVQ